MGASGFLFLVSFQTVLNRRKRRIGGNRTERGGRKGGEGNRSISFFCATRSGRNKRQEGKGWKARIHRPFYILHSFAKSEEK